MNTDTERKNYKLEAGKLFAASFSQLSRPEQKKLMRSDNPLKERSFYICKKDMKEHPDVNKVRDEILIQLIHVLGLGIRHEEHISLGHFLKNNNKVHIARVETLFSSESLNELMMNLESIIPICHIKKLDMQKLYWNLQGFNQIERRQKILADWAKDLWFS